MPIADQTINRLYRCTNEECETEVAYKEKVSQKWRKKCPFCKKHTLILESGNLSMTLMIDVKKPTTLGSLGQVNQARKDKEEGVKGPTRPFWRKKDKVDFNVLKNPKKYIMEGTM